MSKTVCLITGEGSESGTGAASARRFSAGSYNVAMLGRTIDRLKHLENVIPGSKAYLCHVGDLEQLKVTIAQAKAGLGAPSVAMHNAALGRPLKPTLEADPVLFERMFRVNATALMVLVQSVVPDMITSGDGVVIATGATAAWRGKPNHAMFPPTKAAQRILAEAMARDFGPKGVHVAYVTIDAAIDTPNTRPQNHLDKPD